MANLDSMLVHSMACMLYEDKNVSEKQNAWDAAKYMPTKYLGSNAATQALQNPVMLDQLSTVKGKYQSEIGRKYIPAHFNLTGFSHGQNFVVAACKGNELVIDTNWIDNEKGRPIYWKVNTATTKCEPLTVGTS